MALEILYEELKKDFRVEDGRLFRLLKNGKEKEVVIKKNDKDGYCSVGWRGKVYRSHRLMYCLHNEWDVPADLVIDHINGVRLDNSKKNLRLVTRRENTQNQERHRDKALVGCSLSNNGRWVAHIKITDKKVNLGSYLTEQEAHKVYTEALAMLDKTTEEIQEHFGVARFTSKPKGVSFHKKSSKWQANITINGKIKYIGLFQTEESAHQAIQNYKQD